MARELVKVMTKPVSANNLVIGLTSTEDAAQCDRVEFPVGGLNAALAR